MNCELWFLLCGSSSHLKPHMVSWQTSVAAWSPDKDVLALALADGQLSVHRHNWQRLWVAHPGAPPPSFRSSAPQHSPRFCHSSRATGRNWFALSGLGFEGVALTQPYRHSVFWGSASEVTSLCWRPDGKLLAVGHKDGSLALMDLEVSGWEPTDHTRPPALPIAIHFLAPSQPHHSMNNKNHIHQMGANVSSLQKG